MTIGDLQYTKELFKDARKWQNLELNLTGQ